MKPLPEPAGVGGARPRSSPDHAEPRWRSTLAVGLVGVAMLTGCRTVPPLPAVDLQAPGWSVRQGQAVWTAAPGGEGVAGELLLATRGDGASCVQFAKPPFTLATAYVEAGAWVVELPSAQRRFRGRGPAPQRWVWFALAAAVRAEPPGSDWHFDRSSDAGWCLSNTLTGEVLEGFFTP